MDLGLTETQQMLKTSAREFLLRECPITLVREMEEDSRGYTDELWRQIVNLGWTGVPFPEQYGGTGGDFLDLAVLLEEMGRSLVPGPYFSTVGTGRANGTGRRDRCPENRVGRPDLRRQYADDFGA